MVPNRVVSREEWLAARTELLRQEKELTHFRDRLAAERRRLPWVAVDAPYRFEGPDGPATLLDLFQGRRQLVVYHFMLGPGWGEGCRSCSYLADHLDGMLPHLRARDVALAAVSRAPWPEIAAFRRRMGWRFPWVSSFGSDFNYDFHVTATAAEQARGRVAYNYGEDMFRSEEMPGLSVFCRDDGGRVFHTYSAYARGLDMLVGTYNFLDLVPKGRDEDGYAFTMEWVRHHDRYGEDGGADDSDGASSGKGASVAAATGCPRCAGEAVAAAGGA